MQLSIMDHCNKTEQSINIPAIEEKFGGTFIGDFCVKTKSGMWSEFPVAIFYQPNPDTSLGHTNYFGIVRLDSDHINIMKGDSAFEDPITGIIADDGEIIFSRYRHNFVTSSDKSVWVDGGRDYCRSSNAKNGFVKLVICKDRLIIDNEITE